MKILETLKKVVWKLNWRGCAAIAMLFIATYINEISYYACGLADIELDLPRLGLGGAFGMMFLILFVLTSQRLRERKFSRPIFDVVLRFLRAAMFLYAISFAIFVMVGYVLTMKQCATDFTLYLNKDTANPGWTFAWDLCMVVFTLFYLLTVFGVSGVIAYVAKHLPNLFCFESLTWRQTRSPSELEALFETSEAEFLSKFPWQ